MFSVVSVFLSTWGSPCDRTCSNLLGTCSLAPATPFPRTLRGPLGSQAKGWPLIERPSCLLVCYCYNCRCWYSHLCCCYFWIIICNRLRWKCLLKFSTEESAYSSNDGGARNLGKPYKLRGEKIGLANYGLLFFTFYFRPICGNTSQFVQMSHSLIFKYFA